MTAKSIAAAKENYRLAWSGRKTEMWLALRDEVKKALKGKKS